jgi:hypothetical protein
MSTNCPQQPQLITVQAGQQSDMGCQVLHPADLPKSAVQHFNPHPYTHRDATVVEAAQS